MGKKKKTSAHPKTCTIHLKRFPSGTSKRRKPLGTI